MMHTLISRIAVGLALCVAAAPTYANTLDITTANVKEMQAAMEAGAITSEQLVQLYIKRIEAYDQKGPTIMAVLAMNEKVLETARSLDAERKASGPRSPLHGIPVIVKDVFDTYDMPTTGGYLPLKGVIPARDATIVAKLREAGAIMLAKVNQSDWYSSPEMVASSSLGGNTKNPWVLDRTPGWSSSGTSGGLAARFSPIGLGSETGFSIRTPTADGNLFGLSTTSGLISRAGQMWSYITGERGGPMATNLYDMTVTLDVIAGFDTEDLWTAHSLGQMPMEPYVSFLKTNGLQGKRLGVLKEGWDFTPVDAGAEPLVKAALTLIGENGAILYDPVSLGLDLPQVLRANGFPSRYERIHAINQYIIRQGPSYPFKNAEELLNQPGIIRREADTAALANPFDLDRDPGYRATLKGKAALREAVVELMDRYQLDALIYPHKLGGPLKLGPRNDPERQYVANQLSPLTGLPALIVPAGFTPEGLPIALEILGRPWSEPTLLEIGAGYEALIDYHRKVPATTPALPGERITY